MNRQAGVPGAGAVALYGRFSPGGRDRLQRAVLARGGRVARDLTGRTQTFVVGALASALVDTGALAARIRTAGERGAAVRGERAFAAILLGQESVGPPTLPLTTALSGTGLTREAADIMAAFDLIALEGERCRFGDAGVIRTAGELIGQGRSLGHVVRILASVRDLAPVGRHRIVLTPSGEAALDWQGQLTTLEGQGRLPLDENQTGIDDLFEAAALAEAAGECDEAARLYDLCARADRSDAIAPYNFANIRLTQGAHDEAVLAYQRALARDPGFTEARYNLAQALEAAGKTAAAAIELGRVLESDPGHGDALFNLAQLRMQAGQAGAARILWERYLALDPPEAWAALARKAILLCTAPAVADAAPPKRPPGAR